MTSERRQGKDGRGTPLVIPEEEIHEFDPGADPLDREPVKDPFPADYATSEAFANPEPEQCQPIEQGSAARWQEHAFRNWNPLSPNPGFWEPGMCVELARFFVPPSHQGIIQFIDTHTIVGIGDPPDVIPLPMPGVLSPLLYDLLFALGTGSPPGHAPFRFRLNLHPRITSGLPGLAQVVPTASHIPGIPHPALGEWADTRYDFTRPEKRTRLFVPEGHVARLWIEFDIPRGSGPFDFLLAVYGRLAGVTQNYRDSKTAIDESRRWGD